MSEPLERIGRFLNNLNRLQYNENRAIQLLSSFDELDTEVQRLAEQRQNLQNASTQERTVLTRLQADVERTSTELAQVRTDRSNADLELKGVIEKTQREYHRIEFAEALCQLFQEVPRISFELISDLSFRLYQIYATGFNQLGYAIDYSMARTTAISLLEQAIGQGVVRRELYDKVVKQHDDLMMDKLGDMEKERDELKQRRAGVERLNLEKIMQAGLYEKCRGTGQVREYVCPACQVIIMHSAPDPRQNLPHCPFCNANLSMVGFAER